MEQDDDPVDPPKPKPPAYDPSELPVSLGSSSRDLDLSGAERLSTGGKFGMMHPFALLAVVGFSTVSSWGAMMALFLWVTFIGGMMGGSKAVAKRSDEGGKLISPSGAMSRGFMALGAACVAALVAGGLGETALSFYVLNGLWAGLTMLAVRSASKTDAQSGWIAGATSQTAAALFFGVPLFTNPLVPLVVKLTPLFSLASLWYSWKFMGARGTNRSRAALNAAGAAALGTLAFLPATAALLGFSAFEAMCHFTVSMGTLMIPIWAMRDKIRPALSGGGDTTPLAAPERPALPSE